MTTNTTPTAYEGRIEGADYAIYAIYGRRTRTHKVATFDTYDAMLAEWDRLTTAIGAIDYAPNN
ncbi:hypothetical protein [Mycobacteroides abscessus]|uniref:hypothetical protein n=1 Tax=Mycobacteroides abscessus TaxID=36809 RepID=UPI000C265DC6|nr:hypothetical protein [Mycobacteroides abscessus]